MFRIHAVEVLPSTQQSLLAEVRAQRAGPGDVWMARHQTAGQGRRGRSWLSAKESLALSVAVPKAWVWPEPEHQGPAPTRLPSGQLLAHAVLRGLRAWLPCARATELRWKWPNDLGRVLASGELAKVGGILVDELQVQGQSWQVLGLGLNGRAAPSEPLAGGLMAAGLLDGLPAHLDLASFVPFLLEAMGQALRPGTDHETVRRALEASMAYRGEEVWVWDEESEAVLPGQGSGRSQRLQGLGTQGEALLPQPTVRGRLRPAVPPPTEMGCKP